MFHNVSTCNYHFKINELAKEFKSQFECLGENTEKIYYFFNTYNKEFDNGKSIKYHIKFIDSFRFMLTSLSNLLNIYLKDFIVISTWTVNLILTICQSTIN